MIDLRPHLRPGDHVLVGQGTAEPRALLEALIEQRHELPPVRVFVGASYTGLLQPEHADVLTLSSFGGIGRTGALASAGVVDILPVHLGTLPALIRSGRLPVDVVLCQLSEAGSDGVHSLGLLADYLPAAIDRARVVLAEVNPHVPFTFGDTLVPASRLARTVRDERPLIAVALRPPLPEDELIADHVAALIPDGATIQAGVGGTPEAVLRRLGQRRDLGIHSGLLSDAMVDLIVSGAVTNARKEIDGGTTVVGALLGTDRLYAWADRNPLLTMRSLDHTHAAGVLASFRSLHAINSTIEVDLSGQFNAEVAAGRYVGAIGGQGAFARAGATAPNGRSIIAMPSTAAGGSVSRIVATLSAPVVSTARSDADIVVTEHGVADLRGATLRERRERLLAIAAPDLRDGVARGSEAH
jgi:acyl-CoA hydrolase